MKTIEVLDSLGKLHIFKGESINFYQTGMHCRIYDKNSTKAAFLNYVYVRFI